VPNSLQIRALQAQLAAVQSQDSKQKLSNRNCIEIILKLVEEKLLEVRSSRTLCQTVSSGLFTCAGRALVGV
jgi:hypothetical protein